MQHIRVKVIIGNKCRSIYTLQRHKYPYLNITNNNQKQKQYITSSIVRIDLQKMAQSDYNAHIKKHVHSEYAGHGMEHNQNKRPLAVMDYLIVATPIFFLFFAWFILKLIEWNPTPKKKKD